jgi:hypothetical protein
VLKHGYGAWRQIVDDPSFERLKKDIAAETGTLPTADSSLSKFASEWIKRRAQQLGVALQAEIKLELHTAQQTCGPASQAAVAFNVMVKMAAQVREDAAKAFRAENKPDAVQQAGIAFRSNLQVEPPLPPLFILATFIRRGSVPHVLKNCYHCSCRDLVMGPVLE